MSEPISGISVIIPAFNEENAIRGQIESVWRILQSTGYPFELIVVEDGSRDKTYAEASATQATVLRHPRNLGYGASLKHGIRRASHEWILITDADGTYPSEAIPSILAHLPACDMAVGARITAEAHIPMVRRPAKWALRRLSEYLVQEKIPDLNSGLRVFPKAVAERFESMLPNGFSFTTTITLAMVSSGYAIAYEPIEYRKRIGTSKIQAADAYRFFVLILRTVMLFNPLRVFLPLGSIVAILGLIKLAVDIANFNLTDGTVMLVISAILIWAIGLLADQNCRLKSK